MPKFSIVMAYKDGNNSFRRRNLFAVIDRCVELMPDAEIIVAEQGESSQSEVLSNYNPNVTRIQVDDGTRFHKTKLLNEAIKSATTNAIVMVDGDSYLNDEAAKSILNGIELLSRNCAGIIYPYDGVDYLTEAYTRTLLAGGKINSKFCFHGVHIQRQTGLCNMYLKSTWEAVGGFDEDFYEWGAEDDAFTFKIKRLVGPVVRLPGYIYHMFHQQVNTEEYQKSPVYIHNRKLCACIRRMTMDDLNNYVMHKVNLSELVDKYEKLNRLNVRLQWACTKKTLLTIDTTIYDIDYSTEMSFTSILNAVMAEDGAAYIPTFVHDIFDNIPDLSAEQRKEIDDYVEKAKKIAEIGE